MTYAEYYARTASIGAFITPAEFNEVITLENISVVDAGILALHLSNLTNSKIVAKAGSLQIDTSRELDKVALINSYNLGYILKRGLNGFGELETDTTNTQNRQTQSTDSTVNTFKSFPQVVGDELNINNKVAESETVDGLEQEAETETRRELTRQHNTIEATEYIAHMLADSLTAISNEYIKLTALDGIYTQPEDLDD